MEHPQNQRTYGAYRIILPKGEALKAISQLSVEEQIELGKKIYAVVKAKYAKFGKTPVIAIASHENSLTH